MAVRMRQAKKRILQCFSDGGRGTSAVKARTGRKPVLTQQQQESEFIKI